jgi:hypothetical protein
MRTRITVTHLRAAVASLNFETHGHRDISGYVGSYVLCGAYGGWQLQQLANDSGGVRCVTGGYVPARELYELIHAFRHGYRTCRSDLARVEPDTCPVTGDTYGLPA